MRVFVRFVLSLAIFFFALFPVRFFSLTSASAALFVLHELTRRPALKVHLDLDELTAIQKNLFFN